MNYSMTLFLFAAYRNLDSESGLGEAPALARVDSKTAVLLPHKMFKLPLMMLGEHWPVIGHPAPIETSHWSIKAQSRSIRKETKLQLR